MKIIQIRKQFNAQEQRNSFTFLAKNITTVHARADNKTKNYSLSVILQDYSYPIQIDLSDENEVNNCLNFLWKCKYNNDTSDFKQCLDLTKNLQIICTNLSEFIL